MGSKKDHPYENREREKKLVINYGYTKRIKLNKI